MKTQTEMLIEVLEIKYGCSSASSITQALAYCIFGRHSSTLVNYMDTWQQFQAAVTPEMVRDAAGTIDSFTNSLYTRLANYPVCHSNKPFGELPNIKPATTRPVYFDETQCGGVFDGHQVTSDADSGL